MVPEVIEVPLRDSDKVVLVLRIDRDQVPAPITMDGAIWVRLDGRNVKANRQMMAAMLAQARDGQSTPYRLGVASRSPNSHRSVVDPNEAQDQDLRLRAVTSVPLPLLRRRMRMPTGMPDKVTLALARTGPKDLTVGLSLALGAPEGAAREPSWPQTPPRARTLERSVGHVGVASRHGGGLPRFTEQRRRSRAGGRAVARSATVGR